MIEAIGAILSCSTLSPTSPLSATSIATYQTAFGPLLLFLSSARYFRPLRFVPPAPFSLLPSPGSRGLLLPTD